VCAYTNPDLSIASFIMQLVKFAIFAACLGIIWVQ